MNRKITNKIVLIIITFLILSSSLFSAGLADPVGMLEGLFEELAAIFRAIMIGYLILISILLGINYGLRKHSEMMLIVNIVIFIVLIILFCGMIIVFELSISDMGIGYVIFGIPIIITIAGINLSLRKYKPITRIIANIVIFSFIIILIMFMPYRYGESIIGSISGSIRYKPIENLMEAAENNDTNRVNSILKKGKVDVNATNKDGETALMLASANGHLEMVKLLVENGADYTNALRLASREGHLEVVKYLVEDGANINAKNKDSWTALMWASLNGHLEVVKYLIENGADINAKDKDGWTVLMWASREGHLEVVKYLIENGADINAKRDSGWTTLMEASRKGYLEIVKYLIENGANVNAKDEDGETALMWASRYGHLEVVKYLIENGADVNAKDNEGKTALDLADTEEIEEVLRKAGAK